MVPIQKGYKIVYSSQDGEGISINEFRHLENNGTEVRLGVELFKTTHGHNQISMEQGNPIHVTNNGVVVFQGVNSKDMRVFITSEYDSMFVQENEKGDPAYLDKCPEGQGTADPYKNLF